MQGHGPQLLPDRGLTEHTFIPSGPWATGAHEAHREGALFLPGPVSAAGGSLTGCCRSSLGEARWGAARSSGGRRRPSPVRAPPRSCRRRKRTGQREERGAERDNLRLSSPPLQNGAKAGASRRCLQAPAQCPNGGTGARWAAPGAPRGPPDSSAHAQWRFSSAPLWAGRGVGVCMWYEAGVVAGCVPAQHYVFFFPFNWRFRPCVCAALEPGRFSPQTSLWWLQQWCEVAKLVPMRQLRRKISQNLGCFWPTAGWSTSLVLLWTTKHTVPLTGELILHSNNEIKQLCQEFFFQSITTKSVLVLCGDGESIATEETEWDQQVLKTNTVFANIISWWPLHQNCIFISFKANHKT